MQHQRQRGNTFDARVLHVLMDGRVHTQSEIADMFDISAKTVWRAIRNLRQDFTIHTFAGGKTPGGTYLDPEHVYYGLVREEPA